ncbi:unnamed protein product [Sympodiomycopsis kandeliae]
MAAPEGQPVGLQTHPCYPDVRELCHQYPQQAGPLFHSYVDLTNVANWSGVSTVDLKPSTETSIPSNGIGSGWGALQGKRPDGKRHEIVIPCHVTDNMCTAFFDTIFASIDSIDSHQQQIEAGHILLAILSSDSTVVYYKLARGLIKPVN